MTKYVALLRGINVGGHTLIKMAELKQCFEALGFESVSTYINSGNIFFSTPDKDKQRLSEQIEAAIEKTFTLPVRVVVLSDSDIKKVIDDIPKSWNDKAGWRYYLLFVLPPCTVSETLAAIGEPKPDIETLDPGQGVVYQASDMKSYGRSTISKMMGKPIYKEMTIRNLNTTKKLLERLNG